MTSIDPSQRLAGLLRTQVSAFRERGAAARKPGAARSPTPGRSHDAAGAAAQRIQAIARDDPDRKRKALRIFLESVLAQELGQALLMDPSFPEMVDAVQAQMRADTQLAAAADELSEILLAGGPAR